MLGAALGQPHVVVGHRLAVALLERGGGPGDELLGVGVLPLQCGAMGGVGDEHGAGQAGVAFAAGLRRGQQAPAVGKEPVGSFEQVQTVVVLAGEPHCRAVGPKLRRGQERLLSVLLALGDVVHRHGRGGVAGVALYDVDGQAEFGQPGQLGVPESVGVVQPYRPALAVGDLDQVAEAGQRHIVAAGRVGFGAVSVAEALQEQVSGLQAGELLVEPVLLLLDDGDDLVVDEDVVWSGVDFGLGVAEPGYRLAIRGVDRDVSGWFDAVEVTGADLADAPAGEDLQQDHPHHLGIAQTVRGHCLSVAADDEHLLITRQAEQWQRGHDLR